MNDNLGKLKEIYQFLESISNEPNDELRNNIEVKNIYNAICSKQTQKEEVIGWLKLYPEINSDNLINVENMTLDECIIFFKRLFSALRDNMLEHDINIVYDELISDMKNEVPFLFKNFTKFMSIINCNCRFCDLLKEMNCNSIPFVSYEETKKIVSDFFGFIDPSGKIKNLFNNYIDSGNIYAWNKNENNIPEIVKKSVPLYIYYECFFFDDPIDNFINLPLDNNIKDAISLVHEFFHYYIPRCKYDNNNILKEFPSIFFETIFVKYLINLGYNENLLDKIYFYRLANHFQCMSSLEKKWDLITLKEKNKKLKIDNFAEKVDEEFLMKFVSEQDKDKYLKYIREFNAFEKEVARKKILFQINDLNCESIFRQISYLIGKVFTDKILEKDTDIVEASKKVLAVKDIITSNDMSFHYLLSYFDLWDYYYLLENTDKYNPTIPKKIEDKQLMKIKDI